MKILFFLLVLVLVSSPLRAEVTPTYLSTVPKNIYGFMQMPSSFNLYAEPTESSELIDFAIWNKDAVSFKKYKSEPSDVFAVFVPEKKYAFCYVMDEENGWYKVLYDKKSGHSAWVKSRLKDDFWSLKDFYSYYGKKNSLYYLKDVDVRKRSLRSGPSDESQALQGFNVTKNIKLVMIRGNWALVSIIDYDGSVPKTGYIKWRDADGTLLLFPKMN